LSTFTKDEIRTSWRPNFYWHTFSEISRRVLLV